MKHERNATEGGGFRDSWEWKTWRLLWTWIKESHPGLLSLGLGVDIDLTRRQDQARPTARGSYHLSQRTGVQNRLRAVGIIIVVIALAVLGGWGLGKAMMPKAVNLVVSPLPTHTLVPTFTPTITVTVEPWPTGTASPTPEPTVTPIPTSTSTITPTATPPEPSPTPLTHVIINSNLRRGPGTAYPRAGGATAGTVVTATGRTIDGSWIQVDTGQATGWVLRSSIDHFPENAPVVIDIPAPPAPITITQPITP